MLFICITLSLSLSLSLSSKGVPINKADTYFLHVNKIYASYSSWLVMFTYELKHSGTNIRKV